LEVESGADPRQEYDRIRDLPGVIHVEVAFVSIDDPRS
jgi:nitrate reductase NapAB chaperone NapD